MSYNVRNGNGQDGVKSIERCAEVVRDIRPDIVAIQEVDSMTRRNKFYVLGKMAEHTGYHAYFGPTIPYRGGKYGIGVLSKRAALSVEFHPLPCSREPRGLLIVEFDKYYLLCTHLSLNEEDRVTSVGIIRDVVAKLNKPIFIAGDMNAQLTSKSMVAFKEFSEVLSDESKFTIPSDNPRSCIDYILGCNGSFKVLKRCVVFDCIASDHLPIYVDVKIGREKRLKK